MCGYPANQRMRLTTQLLYEGAEKPEKWTIKEQLESAGTKDQFPLPIKVA